MKRTISLAFLLVATAPSTGLAQAAAKWAEMTPPATAPKRSSFDMVWSAHEKRAIVFGGESATGYLDDTWAWDGNTWKQLSPTAKPPRRAGHNLSYDFIRKETTLFSGWNGGSYVADTWVWDGTNWKKATPTTQPPPRDWHGMAYDIGKLNTLMFGGHDWRRHQNNGPGAFGDTWTWDGTKWTQLTPKTDPGKRFGHSFAFDKQTGKVVMLFGSTPGKTYNDMWQWSGTDWVQLKPAKLPPPRLFGTMVYDDARQRLVLYGGASGGVLLKDTWEWNGTTWTDVSSSAGVGPEVDFATAAYDPILKEVVFFGGALKHSRKTPTDATWYYGTKSVGTYSPFGTACGSAAGTPALSANNPVLGKSFTVTVKNLTAGNATFLYLGVSKSKWGAVNLPLNLGVIGAGSCTLYVAPLFNFGMTNSNGTGTWTVTIPNTASVVGIPFYNQAYSADGSAQGGLVVSNAGEGRAGAR